MKKLATLTGAAAALVLALAASSFQTATAEEGLVKTTWPSQEDPGMPFYARVELLPPYIFNDGEWAAITFYRDPACVPHDFNLISVFDIPRVFSCGHQVKGSSLWHGAFMNGAPKIVEIRENGPVPIWFVPWEDVKDYAHAGAVLTIADLQQIEGRLVGHADSYSETLHPHPDPAVGGGGHPNPKMIVDAQGQLEDGRDFVLHISWIRDDVKSVQIQFK